MTPYAALQERVRSAPAQPLLTFYDLASGERMELSATSMGNLVAKTAGFIRDELDLEPGDRIGVHLPLHWQRAVWWAACAATETAFVSDGGPDGMAAVVIPADSGTYAGAPGPEVVMVSLAAFGLPSPVPTGVIDHATASRAHPDTFHPFAEPEDATQMIAAADLAARRALAPGQRILVREEDPDRDLLMLAVPLAIGGSSVLVRNSSSGDLAEIVREEGLDVS